MNRCVFHQFALRRHLDEGGPLTNHLKRCPHCRETIAAHRALIARLANTSTSLEKTPPFLHSRVMNAIQSDQPSTRNVWPRLAWGIPVLAAACAIMFFLRPTIQKTVTVAVEIIPSSAAFKTTLPENPLETEIENLRADTRNAARALASNFLP